MSNTCLLQFKKLTIGVTARLIKMALRGDGLQSFKPFHVRRFICEVLFNIWAGLQRPNHRIFGHHSVGPNMISPSSESDKFSDWLG